MYKAKVHRRLVFLFSIFMKVLPKPFSDGRFKTFLVYDYKHEQILICCVWIFVFFLHSPTYSKIKQKTLKSKKRKKMDWTKLTLGDVDMNVHSFFSFKNINYLFASKILMLHASVTITGTGSDIFRQDMCQRWKFVCLFYIKIFWIF